MVNIWVITDGKPGHQNQSLGLTDALQKLGGVGSVDLVPPLPRHRALLMLCGLVNRRPLALPAPDLIVTTGHQTHLSSLAYKRFYRTPVVVLMKPSLPLNWFDLCLIPHHDKPSEQANVVATYGALNRMAAPESPKEGKPLILLGGPSKHARWDDQAVLSQFVRICAHYPNVLATTSRRTPATTVQALSALAIPNLELVPFEETDANWLKTHLPQAPEAWVTIDSVSMIYEALTAQCRVGVMELEPIDKQPTRVIAGIYQLFKEQLVTPFSEFSQTSIVKEANQTFNEAARCAAIVKERLL
ncbi:MAG: mitochondrial fission ELM1 family protein [Pontibacterium sp.]